MVIFLGESITCKILLKRIKFMPSDVRVKTPNLGSGS